MVPGSPDCVRGREWASRLFALNWALKGPSVFLILFPDLDDLQDAVFSVSGGRSVSSGGFNARNDR